jgi:RNA polymerase sigma factor (sigma-70 family)
MSVRMARAHAQAPRPEPARHNETRRWPDKRLVQGCLRGEEGAWSALIDKYKNLIFSIPIKYGFSADDATDIFQSVCLEMLSELPKLHDVKALPKWIMQVTAHKCFHHRRQLARVTAADESGELPEQATPAVAERILRQAEEGQSLREALSALPPRCRQLIHMLFFEEPARPYQTIAAELGLSPGSIGFIRQRCLDRLRKRLEDAGFS